MRKRRLIIAAVLAQASGQTLAALPAFPGAQGFGANAVGGRNGDVFHVTSLADTNTGSGKTGTLRFGLTTVPAGGRTIVFEVGGSILLNSNLEVKNVSNVTIAGQTAPGPGITIVNKTPANNPSSNFYKFQITSSSGQTTSNIVARYLTIRRGVNDPGATTDDAVGVLGPGVTENIMLDHITASWSTDENLSITGNANKVSVQDSIISESLNPENHAYGSLIRPQINSSVSFNHNLYASNRSRNPRPGNYNGSTLNFDFRNNVVANWSDRAAYTGGSSDQSGAANTERVDANFVGNYFVPGPDTPTGGKSNTAYTLDTTGAQPVYVRMFQSGNKIDSDHDADRDGADTGWGMFAKSITGSTVAFPVDDATGKRMATPFAFAGLDYVVDDSADDAYAKVLASAGGSLPGTRNATDVRIINDVINNDGGIINAPDTAEWNNLYNAVSVARPAGFDSDNDGMPSAWETARGLNAAVDDHLGVAANGYTNLENYLHELTVIATWNKNADASWSGYLNWIGVRPGSVGATAMFGSAISAPRTITIDAPATVGQINFDNASAYTLAGPSAITMSVISGTAGIDVFAGSHTISAPLILTSNTKINVAPATSTLTISNLQPATATITKSGNGKLQIPHAAAPSAIRINTLNITGGTLDLTNNLLVTKSNAAAMIQSGAITSSESSSAKSLAAVANAQLGESTFGGVSVAADDVLVMYTWQGDANLSGNIDADDYFQIDAGYHSASPITSYFKGDFNYDNLVDGDDYALIDTAYSAQFAPGAIAVPEPASISLLTAAALLTRRTRRVSHPPTAALAGMHPSAPACSRD